MRLVTERPDIPLLPYELSRGDEAMRLKTWSPLTTKEVLALADRPDAKLITSASNLLEILLETLAKFALELHGAQTPVRGLWNLQVGTKLYTPIDENGLSDAVVLYLQRELQVRGVFANREVEVTRQPGAPAAPRRASSPVCRWPSTMMRARHDRPRRKPLRCTPECLITSAFCRSATRQVRLTRQLSAMRNR